MPNSFTTKPYNFLKSFDLCLLILFDYLLENRRGLGCHICNSFIWHLSSHMTFKNKWVSSIVSSQLTWEQFRKADVAFCNQFWWVLRNTVKINFVLFFWIILKLFDVKILLSNGLWRIHISKIIILIILCFNLRSERSLLSNSFSFIPFSSPNTKLKGWRFQLFKRLMKLHFSLIRRDILPFIPNTLFFSVNNPILSNWFLWDLSVFKFDHFVRTLDSWIFRCFKKEIDLF